MSPDELLLRARIVDAAVDVLGYATVDPRTGKARDTAEVALIAATLGRVTERLTAIDGVTLPSAEIDALADAVIRMAKTIGRMQQAGAAMKPVRSEPGADRSRS